MRGLSLYSPARISWALHSEVLPAIATLRGVFSTFDDDFYPLVDAFPKAWLHFATAIVLLAQASPQDLASPSISRNGSTWKHFEASAKEIDEGVDAVFARLRFASLDDLEICSSSSLLALFLGHLSKDIMHGHSE